MKRSKRHELPMIIDYRDLPREPPLGLEEVWLAYITCVRQVGIMKSRRPYPDNTFWRRLPSM